MWLTACQSHAATPSTAFAKPQIQCCMQYRQAVSFRHALHNYLLPHRAARTFPPLPSTCLQNQQLASALPQWELPPASKQHAALPGLPSLGGEPLRPANHDAAAAAAVGSLPLPTHLQQQQQQLEQQEHVPKQQAQHQQHQQQPRLGSGCSTNIDWHSPEQVAALLRALHWERLQRQGMQLPDQFQR